jgi:hypothetical protein
MEVLERVAGDAPVWYPKGAIGESMASTAVRVALGVWLMEAGFVPANGWLGDAETETALNVFLEPVERPIARLMIPTISAGGTIASVVLERTARSR